MTGHYEPDHAETDAERAEREHDERLDADARAQEHGPWVLGPPEIHHHGPERMAKYAGIRVLMDESVPLGEARIEQDGREVGRIVNIDRPVLPRDLDDYPPAREKIEQLGERYASVEVDRLPPMGALHWLVRAHKEDGSVDVFRVGSHGSLMRWDHK